MESSGVVVKVLNRDIIVSEFELQWRNYIDFRANTFDKGMKPFIPSAMD